MAINFPSSPGIGSVFTDSTSGFSYEWDGTVWKSYAAASSSSIRIIDDISGSFNGIGKTFALTSGSVALNPKNAASLLINLGGVVQDPFDDYTVSGSNIVFSTAPDAILTFSGIQYGDAIPVTDIVSDAYTRQTYTATSGQTSFNFNAGYTVGFLDVYRNGIKLLPGTDFTATTGTTFVLTDPAVLNDDVEAIGFRISSSTTTEGNITNLTVSGISSLTNLRVTGISTFGITNTLVIDDSGNVTSAAGTITALAFVGDGSGLTGVANTDLIVSTAITSQTLNVTSSAILQDLTVNGTQTIINTTTLEVADINVGIASTATKLNDAALDGAGITIYGSQGDKTLTWDNANSRMAFSTNLYAPVYYGDGSQLDNVTSGIELQQAGSSVGTSLTAINFASGATLTTGSGGISTITIAAGIGTEASSGGFVTLNLSSAQDHKVTATGITTITCSGGTEGDSHTVRIVNSGIATVGFSTYFLFPSGSPPSLPTASGTINLISFTVHRVGTAGTQLLAGAGLNYQ